MLHYQKIASIPLWTARLTIKPQTHDAKSLQSIIRSYVERTGKVVVGAFSQDAQRFTLLLWPETRKDYDQQTIEDCEVSLRDLAEILDATKIERNVVSGDMLHCMMGRKIGGYEKGRIASIDELTAFKDELDIEPGYMISARTVKDGHVQSYGEPIAILTGPTNSEPYIHEIADRLRQYHYAIERGREQRTDFYETKWAD